MLQVKKWEMPETRYAQTRAFLIHFLPCIKGIDTSERQKSTTTPKVKSNVNTTGIHIALNVVDQRDAGLLLLLPLLLTFAVPMCSRRLCGTENGLEMPVFERSEFRAFPIFCTAQTGTPQGRLCLGRLLWLTFLGETRKVSSCRATPDLQS
ncbi:hypothetical protein [Undibacterium pigrum]|uniref:hypothetical protein n=1 Tax=Undibacterium pigrum TaxID=401470 RepID=UPI0011B7F8CA|nr:hypothetical protein [Undibacterium pigrum]